MSKLMIISSHFISSTVQLPYIDVAMIILCHKKLFDWNYLKNESGLIMKTDAVMDLAWIKKLNNKVISYYNYAQAVQKQTYPCIFANSSIYLI